MHLRTKKKTFKVQRLPQVLFLFLRRPDAEEGGGVLILIRHDILYTTFESKQYFTQDNTA